MSTKRHVVIAGASSGIGAALTRALASDRVSLYVCARRADKLREVTLDNALAFGYACDVSQETQVKAFSAEVRARTSHVDAMINCAAVLGAIGPTLQTESEAWFRTVQVNLFGTYLMVKHLVPLMEGARDPRIINFAGGGTFSPFPNYSAYAASKAAVVRLTETLAVELASSNIKVNAVAPGFVATEIHQATLAAGQALAGEEYFQHTQHMLRQGSVPMEVVVRCVTFLLSDAARELTGKTISASFDPWDTAEFARQIPQINQSDLYTLRRINLVNLPQGQLQCTLSKASAQRGPR